MGIGEILAMVIPGIRMATGSLVTAYGNCNSYRFCRPFDINIFVCVSFLLLQFFGFIHIFKTNHMFVVYVRLYNVNQQFVAMAALTVRILCRREIYTKDGIN